MLSEFGLTMAVLHFINRSFSARVKASVETIKLGLILLPRRGFSALPNNFKVDDSVLPVLIVGAGPVGLVLSILLTKLGKTLVKPSPAVACLFLFFNSSN